MTKRKCWPRQADWVRADVICSAREIDELALPIFECEPMTEIEKVQRAGRICRLASEIVGKLEEIGRKPL